VVGNATDLWLVLKSSVGLSDVRNVTVGSGWNGNMTAQDFYATTGNPDATVAYEAVVPAGGGFSGFNVILALRVIYDSAPFAGDGSWLRDFGVHVPVTDAASEVGINSQLLMGAPPPNVLGMEEDWIEWPNGTLHANQPRGGSYQGGAVSAAGGAVLLHDYGQLSGAATQAYVRINAPAPGASAVAVDNTNVLWWCFKNDNMGATTIRFQPNANPEVPNPPENPMDWVVATIPPAGDGSEFEQFGTNPSVNTDPTSPMIAAIVPDGTDTVPGNYPFARLGLRVNGIDLVAS